MDCEVGVVSCVGRDADIDLDLDFEVCLSADTLRNLLFGNLHLNIILSQFVLYCISRLRQAGRG